uniref:Putative ovule protein n=1 Tax=Solanum chacoense TaxID=4108 RepID=A0A0V0GQ14_SOLCH
MGVEGFKEKVKIWWISFKVGGRPAYNLAEKLKLLKGKLKQWSRTNKGNWKTTKGGAPKPNCQFRDYPRIKKSYR